MKNDIKKLSFDFIHYSKYMMSISVIFIFISIYSLIFKGIDMSIDFQGGTIINLSVDRNNLNLSQLRKSLSNDLNQSVGVVEVKSENSTTELILTMEYLENEEILHSSLKNIYSEQYNIIKIESIGPKIGNELKDNAQNAILASIILIGLYIGIRFDGSYAMGSILALIHDIIITLGIFILLKIEISIAVVAAFLTIVGYSLNDTIVIFDRIRENLTKNPHREKDKVINESLVQTLNRTVVTSLTTLIVVIVLYIYGGEVLRPFSLALIIGIILGTYSSLFVASPAMLFLEKKYNVETEES
jgi:preprotein translocase subunit SecF